MALALRKDEGFGLGIAVIAHVAIVAVLLLSPRAVPEVQPPERIEVTISDEVAPTSTSPQPNSQAAPPEAPSLGEPQPQEAAEAAEAEPAPPEPAPPVPAPPRPAPPPPKPQPPEPKPEPAPQPKPRPRPVPKPAPKAPPQKVEPKPAPKAPPQKVAPRPAPKAPAAKAPAQKAPAQKAPAQKTAARPTAQKGTGRAPAPKGATKSNAPAGGSRIGADFLEGVTGAKSATKSAAGAPAAAIGPAVRSSLASSISRQLKPKWQAPQGPGAEELVTILSFNLNRDGSLAGAPTVVRQQGIDAINRNQADRHAEQAIRAVRLAAPFDLPAQYYDAWKRVSAFRFDKRLSQ
jgi:outer membrane biosynthesis protein TonB